MVPVKDEDNAARARPGIASIRHITRTDTRRVEIPLFNADMFRLHGRARTSNTFISVSLSSMVGLLPNVSGT
jgi:hypothetical protein